MKNIHTYNSTGSLPQIQSLLGKTGREGLPHRQRLPRTERRWTEDRRTEDRHLRPARGSDALAHTPCWSSGTWTTPSRAGTVKEGAEARKERMRKAPRNVGRGFTTYKTWETFAPLTWT